MPFSTFQIVWVCFPDTAALSYVVHTSCLFTAKTRMFSSSLQLYRSLVKACVEQSEKPVYVLQYEKLRSNLASELRMLADFLNVSITHRDIHCAVQLQEGHVHRKTSREERMKLMYTVFNDDDMSKLKTLQSEMEDVLKRRLGATFNLSSF